MTSTQQDADGDSAAAADEEDSEGDGRYVLCADDEDCIIDYEGLTLHVFLLY